MRKQHYSHSGPKGPVIYSNKKGGDVTGRTKAGIDRNDPQDLKCIDF